jgi:glycosyltransferase involved in cell wall biosynthesis
MIIAAHFFSSKQQPSYLLPCFRILAIQNPGDTFIFFADPQQSIHSNLPANCKVIDVSPALKNGLLMHYWYNFKLPGILKKYNVSSFTSETAVCSTRTMVPQCLFIRDLGIFSKKKSVEEYASYVRRFFSKFVKTAAAILVTEPHMIPTLAGKYPLITNKISSTRYGLPGAYRPVEPEEHISLLEEFAGGYEFFLSECTASTKQGMLALLKAYSLFKKRLKSGIRLVILLRGVTVEECVPDFKNYKYRGEVNFVRHRTDEKTALLFAAAYAFICFSGETTMENSGLYAMQSHVPVIAPDNPGSRSIYGDAAIFTSPDEKTMADNLMLLYKDENRRKENIEKGILLSSGYNWEYTAGSIWQTILDISRD